MATNINVERLKSSPRAPANANLPPIPPMPTELTERSELYRTWNDQLQTWWRDVKAQLDRNTIANANGTDTTSP